MDKRKKVLNVIRREFLFWGIDTSGLSDEELKRGIIEGGKRVANAGLTAEEAATAITSTFRQG